MTQKLYGAFVVRRSAWRRGRRAAELRRYVVADAQETVRYPFRLFTTDGGDAAGHTHAVVREQSVRDAAPGASEGKNVCNRALILSPTRTGRLQPTITPSTTMAST